MDLISLAWDVMERFEVVPYIAFVLILLLGCLYWLIREYGTTFVAHVMHRRNLPSVCMALLFFCVFWLLIWQDVFARFPVWLRILLVALYGLYLIVVLRSVKAPTLFAGRWLKKHQNWLKRGEACDHGELIQKKPWYLLDANEKLAYQILRGKYLYEKGSYNAAYQTYIGIDQRLLYPEELSDVTYSMVVLLIQQGNLPKAMEVIRPLERANPPAYFAFRSYLEELQGKPDESYESACRAENVIPRSYKDFNTLITLYTQLGRHYAFQNNETEMFRYYHMALAAVKQHGDLRLYHAAYQNLLGQIRIRGTCEEEFEPLLAEYVAAMEGTSLKNQIELENFRIATARERGDRNMEYQAIKAGYMRLHAMADLQEQCMIETSTLRMLSNGGYPASFLMDDINAHFDDYFNLPIPGRINALLIMGLPQLQNEEEGALFSRWGERLVRYAEEQADADLDAYERTLPTDYVNERCWVIRQRVEFLRRKQEQYDGEAVVQRMNDLIQIYARSGQLAKQVEAQVDLLWFYVEMIQLGQRQPDAETMGSMQELLGKAYEACLRIPATLVAPFLLDVAHFYAAMGNMPRARDVFSRFRSSRAQPNHFSLRHRALYERLAQTFAVPG